jgi:hypothetical protein
MRAHARMTRKRSLVAAMLPMTVLAGCGVEPEGSGNDDVAVVQGAVTTYTISGRVTVGGAGLANVPIRMTGALQATQLTNATGNYSFTGLNAGSYTVRAEKANCTFTPSVANLNNVHANTTQNFTASGSLCASPGAPKALVLIDSRLYAQLGSTIDQYKALAEARRGFALDLRKDQQFDAMTFAQVRSIIVSARNANPAIGGVLFIGNIKMPSFYKLRQDLTFARYLPRYYEDLDGVFTKRYADFEVDPVCQQGSTPDTKCVVQDRLDGSGPVTVQPHDFDDTDFGPNRDPELWASFMPVGVAGTGNTYTDFANQLRPYFQKVFRFYNHEVHTNRRLYFVSNDRGERFDESWDAYGPGMIDFYGKPGPQGQTDVDCIVNGTNLCYARWPLESYGSYAAFDTVYANSPWVGENWQQSSIMVSHLTANLYDVVESDEHSSETESIITTAQARGLTNAGLFIAASGCNVAGYVAPGAPASSSVNTTTSPSDNILIGGYLYGSSKAIAAAGEPFWRVHYGHWPLMYKEMKLNGAYLGAAHLTRMKRLYALSSDKWTLKDNGSEMLLGDPFMDLNP